MNYKPNWDRIEERWNEDKQAEKEKYIKEVKDDLREYFKEKGLPSYFYEIFEQTAYEGSDEVGFLMEDFGFTPIHIASLKGDSTDFDKLYQEEFYRMRDDYGPEND
jgi:hypothetical protein